MDGGGGGGGGYRGYFGIGAEDLKNRDGTRDNEKISRTTNQAATAERNAREKEDAFKRDQESTKRKDELNDELKMLAEQEKEFDKQVRRHCHSIETFPTHVLSILHILFGQ